MVRLTDRLDMTIAVDRDVKPQISQRNLAEKKKVCASFLRESSRLRIFVRGVNAKKNVFSSADLYILKSILA